MSERFQLVKMEGDFVARPAWWDMKRRFINWWQGKNVMPRDPMGHPACLEIIEGTETQSRVTYRRS